MSDTAQKLIDHYKLELLPDEGVLYRNTYSSKWKTSQSDSAGSAMVGLLCNDPLSHSRFHQLDCDEIWHFYAGDPIQLHLLLRDGSYQKITLGNNPLQQHRVQHVIPAGVWQAANIAPNAEYALFGCTTTPGFKTSFFYPGYKSKLIKIYPAFKDIIAVLGCD